MLAFLKSSIITEVGRNVNSNTMVGYAKSPLPVFPTSLQESVGVSSVHFVMPWFLTLFSSLPCWDSVLAVWDLIIFHGKYTHKHRNIPAS